MRGFNLFSSNLKPWVIIINKVFKIYPFICKSATKAANFKNFQDYTRSSSRSSVCPKTLTQLNDMHCAAMHGTQQFYKYKSSQVYLS